MRGFVRVSEQTVSVAILAHGASHIVLGFQYAMTGMKKSAVGVGRPF